MDGPGEADFSDGDYDGDYDGDDGDDVDAGRLSVDFGRAPPAARAAARDDGYAHRRGRFLSQLPTRPRRDTPSRVPSPQVRARAPGGYFLVLKIPNPYVTRHLYGGRNWGLPLAACGWSGKAQVVALPAVVAPLPAVAAPLAGGGAPAPPSSATMSASPPPSAFALCTLDGRVAVCDLDAAAD